MTPAATAASTAVAVTAVATVVAVAEVAEATAEAEVEVKAVRFGLCRRQFRALALI
jgi:hypothetical protein